jgi:hypothetical protein
VDNLVVTAIEQVPNTLRDLDLRAAVRAVTIKLVGYAETVRVLLDRFNPDASVVLFGGLAKDRPYPGSSMVTTFNGGVSGPGVVGDTGKWRDVGEHLAVARTPIGRLVTMAEVAEATEFLLRNAGHERARPQHRRRHARPLGPNRYTRQNSLPSGSAITR